MKKKLMTLLALGFIVASCHKDPIQPVGEIKYLMITPATAQLAPGAGAEIEIRIDANVAWKLAIPATGDWVQLDKTEGNGNAIIHIKAMSDVGAIARSVDIHATAPGNPELSLVKITIDQKPYNLQIFGEKMFGGSSYDESVGIISTDDGGAVMAGYTGSNDGDVMSGHGNQDFWVVKVNPNREKIWTRTYGGTLDDGATGIVKARDGGYVILGTTNSRDGDVVPNTVNDINANDLWVIKLNPANGDIVWKKTLGGSGNEISSKICLSGDGGYFVSGQTYTNSGTGDFYVAKLDGNGNLLWQKFSGTGVSENARAIAPAANGGCVVVGFQRNTLTSYDCLAQWFDANGNVTLEKTYGGNGSDQAYAIEPVTDGFIIAGSTSSNTGDFSGNHGGASDVWALHIDNAGAVIKQVMLGGNDFEAVYSLVARPDGACIIVGYTTSSNSGDVHGTNNGSADSWIVKLNKDLQIIWEKSFGTAGDEYITDICFTGGNYMLTTPGFVGIDNRQFKVIGFKEY